MSNTDKRYEQLTEDEERDYWASHSAADFFKSDNIVKMDFSKLKPSTQSISLRLPQILLDRIKILANRKDIPYQSLIKAYLDRMVMDEMKPSHK